MLSDKLSKQIFIVMIWVFIGVFSFCVLSKVVPQSYFETVSMERLDECEKTVGRFAVATITTSVAITFLPDDIGSSIAESLTELDTIFVIILVAIYLEKLILTYGTAVVFQGLVPIICLLFAINVFIKNNTLKTFTLKLVALSVMVLLVIPCGTKVSDVVCNNYMEYVNDVINETETKSKSVSEIITTTDDEQSVLEKISNAFKTAVSSMNDMIEYFKGVIKKCITAVSILILSSCVIPILTLVLMVWIVKQLFNISWNPTPVVRNIVDKKTGKE